ncbi:MAG: NAD-glutamate dehydrogenase, partial [Alphaproteobacteria bacterium]
KDVEELCGAAIGFWRRAQRREAGRPTVAVYNPSLEADGWRSIHTVIDIVNDDMPFLVDSTIAELNRQGLAVHLLMHPIARVKRDASGRLLAFAEPAAGGEGALESFMQVIVDEQKSSESLAALAADIARVLGNVRMAVADWAAMRKRSADTAQVLRALPPAISAGDVGEARAFLDWIGDDHFTFLGYREYALQGAGDRARMAIVPGVGLGILRDDTLPVFDGTGELADLPPAGRAKLFERQLLVVNKANLRSTVHRAVHLDTIGIKHFDAEGNLTGGRMFVGLFTSTVYNDPPAEVPLLRDKIARVMARAKYPPTSHAGKTLAHILATYPRDELFQSADDDLLRIALGILRLQDRQRIALFVRHDVFERFVSCMVYVPRDRYNTELRRKFEAILMRGFGGAISAYYLTIADDAALARVHFIVKLAPGFAPTLSVDAIEQQLIQAGRAWSDDLRDALVRAYGEHAGLGLARRYAAAFPSSYRESVDAAHALADFERLEAIVAGAPIGFNLYRPPDAPETQIRFKLYHPGAPLPLSDVLPMLENMGLRVMEEIPHPVRPDGAMPIWIHDFGLVLQGGVAQGGAGEGGGAIDLDAVRSIFQDAFARVWFGQMENDGFNRLILAASLPWRQVVVLRAYAKYLRQAGAPFGVANMQDALFRNANLARLIVDYFQARTDPQGHGDGADIRSRIEAGLNDVANLDDDRIVRRYVNLIACTLRTNFHQTLPGGGPKAYVSFKLDSRKVDELPAPRPMVEIWVYGPRMEGIHLRFGKVARGGIRWSDRRDDFRTEVLGLVKTQMVKNAVIVPVGSKGGFVVKRPPGARPPTQAEGIECYSMLIRGMLDLTDNLVGDKVAPPAGVRRHDGDDPYLVVAADKGTATFSDIANALSAEYAFWLGDAFASGGSAGYDHKRMGITARGAWECVKRHFRELGVDIQTAEFTCVGIGDMSGDVFGNGMLLSPHTRLIAAFNHLHIFVDPAPDPAASIAERRRLFALPRSSWADYDRKLISAGGGVFERSAKSIPLSAEMQRMFGLTQEAVPPNELISAMLRAPVDLLWFGGIGTYVKAAGESHAQVGDRANDALRVNGRELRAKVIGEGANLGMTQLGRVEYAQAGGRLNTDAIDNSAGVDCSDHEVNIKILFGDVVARGELTVKQRDELLRAMTDEVAALVIRDNYLQSQALSVSERVGVRQLDRQVRVLRVLEKEGKLDRAVEFLPSDEDIAARQAKGKGLTRPELAVLLAYAKLTLFEELIHSDLPDDPQVEGDLFRYFPKPLRERFADAVRRHKLRREIICTFVTNSLVNRAGLSFVQDFKQEANLPAADIARTYIVARDALDLRSLWNAIDALDNKVPAATQIEMTVDSGRLLRRTTQWFLRNAKRPIDMSANVQQFAPGFAEFQAALPSILPPADKDRIEARRAAYEKDGVPADIARRAAGLPMLLPGCDVVRLASISALSVPDAARLYFAVGAEIGLEWLREQATGFVGTGPWDKLAAAALVDDFFAHQFDLAARIAEGAKTNGSDPVALIARWADRRQSLVAQTALLVAELRKLGAADLAMLAVANRQVRSLVAG